MNWSGQRRIFIAMYHEDFEFVAERILNNTTLFEKTILYKIRDKWIQITGFEVKLQSYKEPFQTQR